MINVAITIDAPQHYEAFLRDKVEELTAELNSFCEEQTKQREFERRVQDPAYLQQRYGRTPVVLAKTYGVVTKEDLLSSFRQYDFYPAHDVNWRAFLSPGNVPVYMRGSREMRQLRSGPRGSRWEGYKGQWAENIICRYLRQIQFTSFSRNHILSMINSCTNKYTQGMHTQTLKALKRNLGTQCRGMFCYIKGEPKLVNDRVRWALIKNIEKVEAKLAAAEKKRASQ